jgi:transcriptional regulator GlxA family with amidase domain
LEWNVIGPTRHPLDGGRFETNRQMLEDSAMPVGQVAGVRDFADAGGFTRADWRGSGTTRARWRAALRQRPR